MNYLFADFVANHLINYLIVLENSPYQVIGKNN